MTDPLPLSSDDLNDRAADTWRRLVAAADDPSHPMRLHTLATTVSGDVPDARILTLRGVEPVDGMLWYHTNDQSRTIAQVGVNPKACAVCYDGRDATQLRMSGNVTCHRIEDADGIAHMHWEQLDQAVRAAYRPSATTHPGASHPDIRMREHAHHIARGEPEENQKHFAVLSLHLIRIEWLRVSANGDERFVMERGDDWKPHTSWQ